MAADVRREAVPGHATHPRAHHLDADHQRIRQHHRPAQLVAELRARLRIRGDSARIVVRGSGDEAGAEVAHPSTRGFDHDGSGGSRRSASGARGGGASVHATARELRTPRRNCSVKNLYPSASRQRAGRQAGVSGSASACSTSPVSTFCTKATMVDALPASAGSGRTTVAAASPPALDRDVAAKRHARRGRARDACPVFSPALTSETRPPSVSATNSVAPLRLAPRPARAPSRSPPRHRAAASPRARSRRAPACRARRRSPPRSTFRNASHEGPAPAAAPAAYRRDPTAPRAPSRIAAASTSGAAKRSFQPSRSQ